MTVIALQNRGQDIHHMSSPGAFSHRGQALQYFRRLSDISVPAFAARIGFGPAYVYRIERGERTPTDPAFWQRAATILRIPLALLTNSGGDGNDGGNNDDGSYRMEDEEAILSAGWALFYSNQPDTAGPIVMDAIRRLTTRLRGAGPVATLLSRYQQLAGVLARSMNDLRAAAHHGILSITLAEAGGSVDVHAAALFRLSKTRQEQGNMREAVLFARKAQSMAGACQAPLRGYLHMHLAEMASIAGNPVWMSQKIMEKGENVLGGAAQLDGDGSFTVLNLTTLAHDYARLLVRNSDASIAEVERALADARAVLPATLQRWSVGIGVTEVELYASRGEIAGTVSAVQRVYPGTVRGSGQRRKITKSLRILQQQYPQEPRVRDLIDQLEGR